MTTTERLLVVVGAALVVSAVLLVVYVRQSIPAEAQATGCGAERTRLGQALDQLRFSRSAEATVAAALNYSNTSREKYLQAIATARYQLSVRRTSPQGLTNIQNQLAQASWILADQEAPLAQAQSIIAQDKKEVAAAVPFVKEAARDLGDQDCVALSRTLARSGWPKDRPFSQLALAAHLNSQVSDKLESALNLILRAQRWVRVFSVAAR